MHAYTVSNLAQDAGVSVGAVRDYVLPGLFEAGIGPSELVRLRRALDSEAGERPTRLRAPIASRREALALLDRPLAGMVGATHRLGELGNEVENPTQRPRRGAGAAIRAESGKALSHRKAGEDLPALGSARQAAPRDLVGRQPVDPLASVVGAAG